MRRKKNKSEEEGNEATVLLLKSQLARLAELFIIPFPCDHDPRTPPWKDTERREEERVGVKKQRQR